MTFSIRSSAALLSALGGLLFAACLPMSVAAQARLPVCPVIVTPHDASFCQVVPLPPKYDSLYEEKRRDLALLSFDPDEGHYLLSRQPLFGPGDISC